VARLGILWRACVPALMRVDEIAGFCFSGLAAEHSAARTRVLPSLIAKLKGCFGG
jgi:hypothetical protein